MADDAGQPNAVDDASLISGLRGKLQYLRNQKTPSGLLPAEDKLIVAAVAGNTCTLGSGTRPKQANDERRVRGSFLCFLALGGDETVRVHHRGVDLKGAYIDEDLYLAGADCKGALQFRNCFFEREIVLEYAHLPMLLMDGSRVPGIKADLARIDGSIFLQKGFLAEGQVRLYNAHIGGDLDCRGGTFKQGDDGRTDSGQETALVCTTARINGNVYLCERFRAKGQVRFSSARIGGFVDANDGLFVNAGKPTLVGRNISVGKSLLLENARIMGSVDFYGASVGGELRFSNGRLKTADAIALNLDMISVNGSVLLNYLKTTKGISLVGAHADGRIDCSWASTGDINLYGAHIGGDLECTAGEFRNSTGLALNCATAKIKGSAYLRSYLPPKGSAWHFRTYGEVTFYGAEIAGNLECTGGQFSNAKGPALSCVAARVDGALFLNQLMENGRYGPRFTSKGKVTLTAAKIGLNLQCEGGCFINRGGIALDCGGIDVRLAVYLSKPDEPEEWSKEHNVTDDMHGKPFISKGRVNFSSARIGLDMYCQGGQFTNPTANKAAPSQAEVALDLSSARIEDALYLGTTLANQTPAVIEGSINFEGAHVRQLVDFGFVANDESFPPTVTPANEEAVVCIMTLDGFTYERFGGGSSTGAETRKAWLKRQPREHLSKEAFRPQPFDLLARVLRAMGHDSQARRIAIYKQDLLTSQTARWVRIFAVLLLAAIGTAATLATLTESDIALRTATAFVALTESEIGRRAATALAALTANVISWIVVIILLMTLYSSGGLGWLGRVSLGLLVAYGYRPARVLVLALILGVGFAPIFQQAAERGLFLPKDAAAAQQLKCGPDWTQCQPHPFVPIIYSFDTMLPFKFGHADKWSLQREPFRLHLAPQMDVPIALEWLIWFEIAFGWTTSGIILVLISGSLKKD